MTTEKEFDIEKDYLAILDANRDLQSEVAKLKQLLVQSQKERKELQQQLNEASKDNVKSMNVAVVDDDEDVVVYTKSKPKPVTTHQKKKAIVIEQVEEEEEVKETVPAPSTKKSKAAAPAPMPTLDELGELIEWSKMLKLRYPGSWATMSSRHKQRAAELVKEFLTLKLKSRMSQCMVPRGAKELMCIPEALSDTFGDFFDEKLDEGALNVLGSPKAKQASMKKTPAISTGVSKKNTIAKKNVEPESPAKSPRKPAHNSPGKPIASGVSLEEFIAKSLHGKPSKTTTITVAEMDVEQLINTESALKIVNILTSKYAEVSVEENDLRALIEKLCEEENIDEDSVCKAFEKKFSPPQASNKRKSPSAEDEAPAAPAAAAESSSKKAKTDSTVENDMFRYNALLRTIAPDFNKTDEKVRVEMKKRVKTWLKGQMGDAFNSCISHQTNGAKKDHKTYLVPKKLEKLFLEWAAKALPEIQKNLQ